MIDREEYNRLDWEQDIPRTCATCERGMFCDDFSPNHSCRLWSLNPHYTGDWEGEHEE